MGGRGQAQSGARISDLYPDFFAKAAALLESLGRNHPFIDGNKRTAITATGIFLRRNSFSLAASQEELYDFTMKMAEGLAGQAEAEAWLRMHVNPL